MLHLLSRGPSLGELMGRLEAWRPAVRQRVVAIDYVQAVELPDEALVPGVWAFLGIDRLDDDSAFAVMRLRARLAQRPGVSFLNHPTRTLHRFEMLRLAHQSGLNVGDVRRFEDLRPPVRWPVFLQDELQPLLRPPPLISGPPALWAELRRLDDVGTYRPTILLREAPGLAGDAATGRVAIVGGGIVADPAARALLSRAGAQEARRFAALLPEGGILLGGMTVAATADGVMILDVGTDPALLPDPMRLPAMGEALLTLARR